MTSKPKKTQNETSPPTTKVVPPKTPPPNVNVAPQQAPPPNVNVVPQQAPPVNVAPETVHEIEESSSFVPDPQPPLLDACKRATGIHQILKLLGDWWNDYDPFFKSFTTVMSNAETNLTKNQRSVNYGPLTVQRKGSEHVLIKSHNGEEAQFVLHGLLHTHNCNAHVPQVFSISVENGIHKLNCKTARSK